MAFVANDREETLDSGLNSPLGLRALALGAVAAVGLACGDTEKLNPDDYLGLDGVEQGARQSKLVRCLIENLDKRDEQSDQKGYSREFREATLVECAAEAGVPSDLADYKSK